MTEHKATPEQWDDSKRCADAGAIAFACLLELRARVEALEADGPAVSCDREPASVAAQPTPASSLVERVVKAMDGQPFNTHQEARAAIREVAAWLEDESTDIGMGTAGNIAERLREEAER